MSLPTFERKSKDLLKNGCFNTLLYSRGIRIVFHDSRDSDETFPNTRADVNNGASYYKLQ